MLPGQKISYKAQATQVVSRESQVTVSFASNKSIFLKKNLPELAVWILT